MIGTKVGKWLIIEQVKVPQKGSVFRYYSCQCECGVLKNVRADGLRNGRSTQCEECRKRERYIDTSSMINQKYGEWLVLFEADRDKSSRKLVCRCKCGTERIIPASTLKLGKNKQCHLCYLNLILCKTRLSKVTPVTVPSSILLIFPTFPSR